MTDLERMNEEDAVEDKVNKNVNVNRMFDIMDGHYSDLK
jgi:hypothetical protein